MYSSSHTVKVNGNFSLQVLFSDFSIDKAECEFCYFNVLLKSFKMY